MSHPRPMVAIWWACLLALLAWSGEVLACTDVILRDNCTNDAVVSGRTLSFPMSVTPAVSWAAPGASLTLLEVAPGVPSTLGTSTPVKYGFVCTSHARYELGLLFPDKKDPVNAKNFLWCVDGLNTKGLSAAALYQPMCKTMTSFDKTSSKKDAINFLNMGAIALAKFDTVAALKKYLQGDLQVTWSSTYDKFVEAVSFGSAMVTTLHMIFHDATGASLVLQYRDGKMEVLDNPLGVFANFPLLQENYKNYEDYRKRMFSNPAGTQPSVRQAGPDPDAHGADSGAKNTPKPLFWPVPGDYSGPSRFTRMALIKEATQSQCWRNKSSVFPQLYEIHNPGFVLKVQPASNPTIMSVMGILNTVYQPNGVTGAGLRGPTDLPEYTLYTAIRDHNATVFYYRTGNSPQYKAIDLKKVDWGALPGGIAHSYLVAAQEPWFSDYTNEFKEGVWGSGSMDLVTKGARRL